MPRFFPALLIVVALLLSSCGKKAPPIRPERLVPEAVEVSAMRNVAEGIRLFWPAPKLRVDKKKLEGLRQFLVFRAEGASRQSCLAPGNPYERIGVVKVPRGEGAEDLIHSYLDDQVVAGRWYVYRVLAEDVDGNISNPQEGVPIIRRGTPPPAAPQPELTVGDGFLSFHMRQFPEGVVGWYVYRGATGSSLPVLPLFAEPVTSREYTDAGLVNDVPQQYAFSFLAYDEGFPVEGERSEPLVAAARDLVAPVPPGSLVGVAVKDAVDLRWERVEEPGVRYHVYRRLESQRSFSRLTDEPLTANAYVDKTTPGRYVYAVSAVDGAGNESSRSPETAVRVR